MRLTALAFLALTFGGAVACGGSESGPFSGAGGEGSGSGLPLAELPTEYAAALCKAYTTCNGDLYAIFLPGEDCATNISAQLAEELATLPHAVDAGRIAYDPVKAQACIDEIAAGDCATLSQRASATCQAALSGSVPEDGDCELNEECQKDLYCKIGDACPGTCSPLEAAGRACSADGQCMSGLKCGATGLCVAPAEAGGACNQGEPDCTAGYVCLGDNADQGTPGECVAIEDAFAGETGDACSLTRLCKTELSCEIEAVSPIAGTCVEHVAADAACQVAVPDECPTNQYCKLGINPLADGACTVRPAAGEPCAQGLGGATLCAAYARCDGGVCRELAAAGEGCSASATCYSGRCENGACVAGNGCQ